MYSVLEYKYQPIFPHPTQWVRKEPKIIGLAIILQGLPLSLMAHTIGPDFVKVRLSEKIEHPRRQHRGIMLVGLFVFGCRQEKFALGNLNCVKEGRALGGFWGSNRIGAELKHQVLHSTLVVPRASWQHSLLLSHCLFSSEDHLGFYLFVRRSRFIQNFPRFLPQMSTYAYVCAVTPCSYLKAVCHSPGAAEEPGLGTAFTQTPL